MPMKGKPHHTYRSGGRPKEDADKKALPEPPPSRSWQPGYKGQGAEGLSKGYGGSSGRGTGPSGAEDGRKSTTKRKSR